MTVRSHALPLAALATTLAGCPSDPMPAPDGGAPDAFVATDDTGTPVDAAEPIDAFRVRPDAGPLTVPATYEFESRFEAGRSSVAYSGQTARQVALRDLTTFIRGLTMLVDTGALVPAEGDIVAGVDLYFRDASLRADEPIRLATTPEPALQATHGELSTTAQLFDKVAGNDASTDYVPFSVDAFRGWSDASLAAHGGSIETPSGFLVAVYSTLDHRAFRRGEGDMQLVPGTTTGERLPIHVTEEGLDLSQFSEKTLLMAMAYHQAVDDYLDDEAEDTDKGLLADNEAQVMGQTYTNLEHQWDEGYGYFGAARDLSAYTNEDLLDGSPWRDTSVDGRIDFRSEINFAFVTYLARRDSTSAATARTSFLAEVDEGFRTGRAIITAAGGALTPEQLMQLRAQRDRVVQNWDAGMAATTIHYINRVIRMMLAMGTPEYNFLTHAAIWSEVKVFALGMQFHRASPILARFDELHTLLGDRPVLASAPESERMAYLDRLRQARALVAEAYGFDAANVGDELGANGW
jgi:hypothetical protein